MVRLAELSFEQANATVLRQVFAGIDARAAVPALAAAMNGWRPDVLVREPAELGSLAAAERAGVPHVQVAIGMTEMSRLMIGSTVEPVTGLGRLVGLPDGSLGDALAAEPILSSVPATLDRAGDGGLAAEAVAFRYRDDDSPEPPVPLPPWGDP